MTADRDVDIKLWKFAFPSTASSVLEEEQNGSRIYYLSGRDGKTVVKFSVGDGTRIGIMATGDGKLGKGVLGAIPIHIVAERENIRLAAGQKLSWEISVEPK